MRLVPNVYAFNPPLEGHAWLMVAGKVVDVAVAGIIEEAVNMVDEQGPFLVGRLPILLAGVVLDWIEYRPHTLQGVKSRILNQLDAMNEERAIEWQTQRLPSN